MTRDSIVYLLPPTAVFLSRVFLFLLIPVGNQKEVLCGTVKKCLDHF